MRYVIMILVFIGIVGCNSNEGKSASVLEKVIKKTTGVDTDVQNIQNPEANKVKMDITDDGLNLNKRFQNGFATITATSDGLVVTIVNEDKGTDNIHISFSYKNNLAERPIKGRHNNKGENSLSFSIVNYKNNEMDMMMGYDLECEIISLKPEKTILRLKGKIGYPEDAQETEKWQSLTGTITLNYPIFQALGISKETLVY